MVGSGRREEGGSERGKTQARRKPRFLILWDSSDLVLSSPELKGLGADFTFGFIQVMDGEKNTVIFWWPSTLSMTSSLETTAWVRPCSFGLAGWGLSDERLVSPPSFSVAFRTFCGGVV